MRRAPAFSVVGLGAQGERKAREVRSQCGVEGSAWNLVFPSLALTFFQRPVFRAAATQRTNLDMSRVVPKPKSSKP